MVSSSSILLVQSSEQLSTRLDNQTAMVDMSSGKYFHLNPTGSWIWEQFKQPNETGKVTSAFAKHFQVPEQIASKDVGALVQDLLERGLLQHASPPSN